MRSQPIDWQSWRAKRNAMINDVRDVLYFHIHRMRGGKNEPLWRGVRVVKFPTDLLMYAEAMWQNRPDWIIETGTAYGGSSLFFADMLTLTGGNGKVITVDIEAASTDHYGHGGRFKIVRPPHPKLEYVTGSSIDPAVVKSVCERIPGKVMVVLDSNHKFHHVSAELMVYKDIVTVGQFLVVEDSYAASSLRLDGPGQAIAWFLKQTDQYVLDPSIENKYLIGMTRGGWLRRVK